MAVPQLLLLAPPGGLLRGVLYDRLQHHAVEGFRASLRHQGQQDQRLVHLSGEDIQHVHPLDTIPEAGSFRRLQREGAPGSCAASGTPSAAPPARPPEPGSESGGPGQTNSDLLLRLTLVLNRFDAFGRKRERREILGYIVHGTHHM